jgi:hypothetical protein
MGNFLDKVNAKTKFPLSIIKQHAINAFGGVEIFLHTFLTLVFDGRDWSALPPCCFTPRETVTGNH